MRWQVIWPKDECLRREKCINAPKLYKNSLRDHAGWMIFNQMNS
jgi:hypothetical protein